MFWNHIVGQVAIIKKYFLQLKKARTEIDTGKSTGTPLLNSNNRI